MKIYVLEILTFTIGEYETTYPVTTTLYFTTIEAAIKKAEEMYVALYYGEFYIYKIAELLPIGEEVTLEIIKEVTYK